MIVDVQFTAVDNLFEAQFTPQECLFDIDFGVVTGVASEVYKGTYEMYPGLEDSMLLTKDKLMKDDVTFKAIPRYVVENPSGGKTITIGG